jgi:preprotein translocase subunit SecB
MKKSPVQIVEMFYPTLSYEANPRADSETFDRTLTVDIESRVTYFSDDEHMARLTIRQNAIADNLPYSLNLEAYAVFTFDKESAKQLYGDLVILNLAVNVVSILFSSSREVLAHATSRGPYGASFIEGVIIDAASVEIDFEENPKEMVPRLFGIAPPTSIEVKKVAHKSRRKSAKNIAKK